MIAMMVGWFLAIVLLMFGSIVARKLLMWMLLWTFLASFLPPWGQAVFTVVAGLMVLQGFGAFLLGKHAADSMVGSLTADLSVCFQNSHPPVENRSKIAREGTIKEVQ
jgi:hypothetical protein